MKLPKDTYSIRRYEDLAFAVAHYGLPIIVNSGIFVLTLALTKNKSSPNT